MNVLHVTPGFYPAYIYGGPIESVYQLCRYLGRAGCYVKVLTTDANGPKAVLNVETSQDVEIEPGLSVRYCHRIIRHTVSPTLLHLLPACVRMADVVHVTSVYSFPTIPTLYACKILGKPTVWSPRGAFQLWEGTRRMHAKAQWDRICRAVLPEKLVLHTTSEQEAEATRERIKGKEIAIIPNGVETAEEMKPGAKESGLRLLYIGRLHPIKAIENLLKACRMLDADRLSWSLTVAGSGDIPYTAKLCDLIAKLSLQYRVKLVGEVTGAGKEHLYSRADLVVLPSHSENFGLVVAEALAHRIPVIASRGTPWKEVEERGCGLWVSNDPKSLAAAMMRMSRMPLAHMGNRGRDWMWEEFSWRKRAQQMLACYSAISNKDSIRERAA